MENSKGGVMLLISNNQEPKFKDKNEFIFVLVNERTNIQIDDNIETTQYQYDYCKILKIDTLLDRTKKFQEILKLSEQTAYELAVESMKFQYGEQFIAPIHIPANVTARQAHIYLNRIGLLDIIETLFEQLPEPEKTEAKLEWHKTSVIERNNTLLQKVKTLMNWAEEDIDIMFVEANKI
ncbi:MAG: hypothetical protein WCY72_08885 [Lysobacteraceae bacterium]